MCFECLRKLALTGMLVFVFPGSASQLFLALLIALGTKEYNQQRRPLIEDSDDTLANIANGQIVLMFLCCLAIHFKKDESQDGAAGEIFEGPVRCRTRPAARDATRI